MGEQLISSRLFSLLPSKAISNSIITSFTDPSLFIMVPIGKSLWADISILGIAEKTDSLGMVFFMRYFPSFCSSILFKMTGRTKIFPIIGVKEIFLTNICEFESPIWFTTFMTNSDIRYQLTHSIMFCSISYFITFPTTIFRSNIITFSTQFMILFRFCYGNRMDKGSYILLFMLPIIIYIMEMN